MKTSRALRAAYVHSPYPGPMDFVRPICAIMYYKVAQPRRNFECYGFRATSTWKGVALAARLGIFFHWAVPPNTRVQQKLPPAGATPHSEPTENNAKTTDVSQAKPRVGRQWRRVAIGSERPPRRKGREALIPQRNVHQNALAYRRGTPAPHR